MSRLHDLFEQQGQSPWLDNLKREYLQTGELARLVEQGVRGVTSNPSIFQKAIAGSEAYDEQFRSALRSATVEQAYWELVISDIEGACKVLAPVHEDSGGTDGFVSIEVAPGLAHNTEGTTVAARSLHERIALPNLMVKIPATAGGIAPIRSMIAEGRNVNVTLIFSLPRYAEVIEAYLSGLEALVAKGGDPSRVQSVASFFISRVDTEVDRRLDAIGTDEALALRGRGAVAQAKLAYALFQGSFSGPRWEALAAKGAKVQRPLWASTSTKNPDYPELVYVESLIGPDTVNTLPEPTLHAFAERGVVSRTADAALADAEADWQALQELGVDVDDIARVLEDEGVASFVKAFDELLQTLQDKAASIRG